MKQILLIIPFIIGGYSISMAQSSANQLAQQVAQSLAKNDTSSLFKLLPDYNHLMAYFKKHGVPMPSADEVKVSKVVYENNVMQELKEDLMYERESCVSDGFDWSQMTVSNIEVKKEKEAYEEGSNVFLTTHMITLDLKDRKNKFTLELAAFEVNSIYKLLNILNTNLESL